MPGAIVITKGGIWSRTDSEQTPMFHMQAGNR
jgi:hypothetical protein